MKSLVIAATLLAAAATAPSAAEAAGSVRRVGDSYIVRSGGLDLSTSAGRAAYTALVAAAVEKQCRKVSPRTRRDRCAAEAMEAAIAASTPAARTALQLETANGVETAAN